MQRRLTTRTRSRLQTVVLAVVLAAAGASALAGAFYEHDGVALRGYDPVAYFREGKPVKGSAAHTATYQGSVFHFASAAHRDAFAAAPAQYAPQYQGFCAFGVAQGYKAVIDPAAFTIVANKLYLNDNAQIQRRWRADIPGYIATADQRWPAVVTHTTIIE